MLYKLGISDTMDAAGGTADGGAATSSCTGTTGDVVSYPCELLSCGPLVVLAQGISTALHNIRECTPVALDGEIRKQVLALLQNEAVYICEEVEYAASELSALGHMFVEVLLPLVQQIISAVSNRAPPSIQHIVDIFVRNDIYQPQDVPLVQASLLDDAASEESSEDKPTSGAAEDVYDVPTGSRAASRSDCSSSSKLTYDASEEQEQEPVSDTKSTSPHSSTSM